MAGTKDEFDEYFYKRVDKVIRPGITGEEMMTEFDSWASCYEHDMSKMDYAAPLNMANAMTAYYTEEGRAKVKILDIGAGTGLIAEAIRKVGFCDIDGLDPNKPMLDRAREKGLYTNYFVEFFTPEPTSLSEDTYDCLTASACFVDEHVPFESFREVVRIVKPGGMVFIGTRKDDSEYFQSLDKYADSLEEEGKWKRVDTLTTPSHYRGLQGLIRIFRVV